MHYDVQPGIDPKPYYASAFGIGVAAAGVMTLLMWGAREAGWTQLDLPMSLGTVTSMTPGPSPGAWFQGFLVMLTCGGVFALVYAWVFEAWPHHEARAWLGAIIGAVHALIGGALFGMLMPGLHSGRVASEHALLANPGFMGMNYGLATVLVFFLMHIVFGAIVGAWMHAAPLATRYLHAITERYHRPRVV